MCDMRAKSLNVPEYWDTIWGREVSLAENRYNIARSERSARWKRIDQAVVKTFGGFRGLRAIEIGAGQGSTAALMAARGAAVTVLDNSEASIDNSRRFFAGLGLSAEFALENALNIGPSLKGQYDIAMSFGLAEHFAGENRKRIIAAHFDVLKDRGLAFISVPNKWNPPYRLYKCLAELKGSWPVEEYPFSRVELRAILREAGIQDYYFFGDSIAESASWLYSLTYKVNPMVLWRRVAGTPPSFDVSRAKQYRGTALDEYFSYSLVVCGRPPVAHGHELNIPGTA